MTEHFLHASPRLPLLLAPLQRVPAEQRTQRLRLGRDERLVEVAQPDELQGHVLPARTLMHEPAIARGKAGQLAMLRGRADGDDPVAELDLRGGIGIDFHFPQSGRVAETLVDHEPEVRCPARLGQAMYAEQPALPADDRFLEILPLAAVEARLPAIAARGVLQERSADRRSPGGWLRRARLGKTDLPPPRPGPGSPFPECAGLDEQTGCRRSRRQPTSPARPWMPTPRRAAVQRSDSAPRPVVPTSPATSRAAMCHVVGVLTVDSAQGVIMLQSFPIPGAIHAVRPVQDQRAGAGEGVPAP